MTAFSTDHHNDPSGPNRSRENSENSRSGRTRGTTVNQILQDYGLLLADSGQELNEQLDNSSIQLENTHKAALEAAIAEHEHVRQSAERAQALYMLQLQTERKTQENAELQELERQHREKVENEMRVFQMRKHMETEKQRAEEKFNELKREQLRNLQEEQSRHLAEKAAIDDKTRRVSEEAERQRLFETQNREREKAATTPSVNANVQNIVPQQANPHVSSNGIVPDANSQLSLRVPLTEREMEHARYLKLHAELKLLRQNMISVAKDDVKLKQKLGDMRRQIKKSVGQLTVGKGANHVPIRRIKELLHEALQYQKPSLDVRKFIVAQAPDQGGDAQWQAPGLLLYLLNIFAKSIIAQFIDEASVSPKSADPVGVVAVSIFADQAFQWQRRPLIDILMAKYHYVCPVLWGVHGSEKTESGRKRLGWGRIESGGPWVSEQRHGERMTGLGAGYAALTLRDFSKSKLRNPLPALNYWRSLAFIINTAPDEAVETHFLILKAMVEHYVPKFIGLYGGAAIAALQKALVEFPARAPKSVAASAVAVLPEVLKRDHNLTL